MITKTLFLNIILDYPKLYREKDKCNLFAQNLKKAMKPYEGARLERAYDLMIKERDPKNWKHPTVAEIVSYCKKVSGYAAPSLSVVPKQTTKPPCFEKKAVEFLQFSASEYFENFMALSAYDFVLKNGYFPNKDNFQEMLKKQMEWRERFLEDLSRPNSQVTGVLMRSNIAVLEAERDIQIKYNRSGVHPVKEIRQVMENYNMKKAVGHE